MKFDSEWKKYEGGPTPPRAENIRVTLSPKGEIYLNPRIYDIFGRPEAVQFYFHPDKNLIVLKPAHARLPESFPVRPKSNGSLVIRASPFCGHHGIRLAATQRFIHPDVDDDGMLILDLTQTVTVSRPHQRKRKRSSP